MRQITRLFFVLLCLCAGTASANEKPGELARMDIEMSDLGYSTPGFSAKPQQKVEALLREYDPGEVTVQCVGKTNKVPWLFPNGKTEPPGGPHDKILREERGERCKELVERISRTMGNRNVHYYAEVLTGMMNQDVAGARLIVIDKEPPPEYGLDQVVIDLTTIKKNVVKNAEGIQANGDRITGLEKRMVTVEKDTADIKDAVSKKEPVQIPNLLGYGGFEDGGMRRVGFVLRSSSPIYAIDMIEGTIGGRVQGHVEGMLSVGRYLTDNCALTGGLIGERNTVDAISFWGPRIGGLCTYNPVANFVMGIEVGVSYRNKDITGLNGPTQLTQNGTVIGTYTPQERAPDTIGKTEADMALIFGLMF